MKTSVTLCVLSCIKTQKYEKRLFDFIKSYGFKHINKDIKLKVVFLVDDELRPSYLDEEFIWFNCPNLPLSSRFIKYLAESDDDSDWILQVDDDSSTDIDKTVEFLNRSYCSKDSLVLIASRMTDLDADLKEVLNKMNYSFLVGNNHNTCHLCDKIQTPADHSKYNTVSFKGKLFHWPLSVPYFIHGWELSIFSKSAVKRIKKFNRLKEFFDLISNYSNIHGDQIPCVIAFLSKIPIVECLFVSSFCEYQEYTAINPKGRFSHIHFVNNDWDNYEEFLNLMIKFKKKSIPFKFISLSSLEKQNG